MKVIRAVFLIVIMILTMSMPLFASERVVCDVEVLSDQSANVQLRWHEGSNKEGIRITGWTLINGNTLKITYITGNNVEAGWDSRKIEGSNYQFPMKIVLSEEGKTGTNFTDLPADLEAKESILNLYYQDILSGYLDGSFKPGSNVTRAEFAKMVAKTADYELASSGVSPFKDIKAGFWGLPYITTLAGKEIFKGRSNGNFDPSGNITVGEIVAVIHRTFILYNNDGTYPYTLTKHWSNEDFTALVQGGILLETDGFYQPYKADVKATRVQCALLLSRVLEQMHQTK
ncbi:MAG: S-layer homology domain-containing protein [Vallitaleaceae bacterium]|nr:S-layer homology domain-containing protein [Vallitaleaceae bacterium]